MPADAEHARAVNAVDAVAAFAPGRVNLIGEHTDYNHGLALPFAIEQGVTVRAVIAHAGAERIVARAENLGESDEFALAAPPPASGWRAFVRGVAAELSHAGVAVPGAEVSIGGELPQGAGLSSSAAVEVSLCLALLRLAGATLARTDVARLCSRVENDWVGARTGLLDPLASLYGTAGMALCIDFRTRAVERVPLRLDGWRIVLLDSGERHTHANSGYNERRAECARACALLGVASLRDAALVDVQSLPEPLRRRATHVIQENERVRRAVAALRENDLPELGKLLDASHASLRDNYDVSTPAVERTVQRLRDAGASGARIVGGGFGGSVLALFAPTVSPPHGAREVRPAAGAHVLATSAATATDGPTVPART